MGNVKDRIKNFIRLHTSEMEDTAYIALLRGIAEWANSEADATEYRMEEGDGMEPED